MEDWMGYEEGSCITEAKFKNVFYLDKPLFEVIQEFEIRDMLKYDDEKYCSEKGIEFLLFYTPAEMEVFLNKNIDYGIVDRVLFIHHFTEFFNKWRLLLFRRWLQGRFTQRANM